MVVSGFKVVVPPDALFTPVELRAYLKVSASDEAQDTLTASMAAAAVGMIEKYTGRAILSQSVEVISPVSNIYTAPLARIGEITSATAIDAVGAETPIELVDCFALLPAPDGDRFQLRPTAALPAGSIALKYVYVAGTYSSTTAVPDDIKLAVLRQTGWLYDNRGLDEKTLGMLDMSVRLMICSYRRSWL